MNTSEILQKVISFRRQMHMYPETSFNQYQTRERIKKILIEFGIHENQLVEIAKTGLIVDIKGRAPQQGKNKCVAFRADIDALSMTQNNHHLEHRSKNQGAAHMCGHDGHTACLIGFVPLLLNCLDKIPKNKTVRLLFQPSQQGPSSGAQLMVKQGCLDGVDEVYGFHGAPMFQVGHLFCKPGIIMSQSTIIKIKIIGSGGHGSDPNAQKVAVVEAVSIYQQINNYFKQLMTIKKGLFSASMPVFHAGQMFNVISETADIEGTLRSLQAGLRDIVVAKINQILSNSINRGFKVQFKYETYIPLTENSKQQTQNVLRVAQKIYGKQKVGYGPLPVLGSQDFAYYTQVKPGAYFFISTGVPGDLKSLHNSNYDFNDEVIQTATKVWYELAIDRLGICQQSKPLNILAQKANSKKLRYRHYIKKQIHKRQKNNPKTISQKLKAFKIILKHKPQKNQFQMSSHFSIQIKLNKKVNDLTTLLYF